MVDKAGLSGAWGNMLPVVAVVSPMITAFILSIGLVTFLVVNPINARIDRVEARTNARFDKVESHIDKLESRMNQRFDALTEILLSMRASSKP